MFKFSIRLNLAQEESPTPRTLFRRPLARRFPKIPSAEISSLFLQQAISLPGYCCCTSEMGGFAAESCSFGGAGPTDAAAAITNGMRAKIVARMLIGKTRNVG
jgi:hypothetical protein